MNRREFLGTLSYLLLAPTLGRLPGLSGRTEVRFRAVEFNREPTNAELDLIAAKEGVRWWEGLGSRRALPLFKPNESVDKGGGWVAYQILDGG